MNTPTDIDRSAPVLAHHQIDIRAPLNTVWRLHTAVNEWPTWNPEITAAKIDGAFVPGNSFTWTSYGFTVTSTIYEVVEGSHILWGGTANGITGMHEWVFEAIAGGVHVMTNESFAGQPVEAGKAQMQALLDATLTAWLDRLKTTAESGA
jgi:uncharacterized protein YndB with AHSA1/START domain